MKKLFFITNVLIFVMCSVSFGQKYPSVQLKSIHSPANVKIDGKVNEWSVFQAYNNKVQIYYTLANDSNNIYLIIKSDNKIITSKILQGGIKFSIKKNDKKDVVVTYPAVDTKLVKSVYNLMPKAIRDNGTKRTDDELAQDNFALNASNKEIVKLFKLIGVAGIDNIQDSEIPIYNSLNIKVSASFDPSGAYICEFSLPLKYISNNLTDNLNPTLARV